MSDVVLRGVRGDLPSVHRRYGKIEYARMDGREVRPTPHFHEATRFSSHEAAERVAPEPGWVAMSIGGA